MASEAEVKALRHRVRTLEQALEPFAAAFVPPIGGTLPPHRKLILHIEGRHLERAWRLLIDRRG